MAAPVGRVVVALAAETKGLQSGLGKAQNLLKKFGVDASLSMKPLKMSFNPVVMGFKAVAGAVKATTAALTTSVQISKDFEAQFSVVRAITSGSTSDFKALETAIMTVSSNTEITNQSMLRAAEVFGRAGFKAGEIGEALETVGDLATASGMDVSQAANLSVRMLKSFGMKMEELPVIANQLAHASANANVSIGSLAEGFKFTGAIASNVGLEFSDVTTALSLLGETGLEAGLAGRALQAMIMDLSKPTDQAKKKLFEMGIITHDAAGQMLPMETILKQLVDSNMTAADSFEIFNRNSARAVTALSQNVRKYGEFREGVETTTEALKQQSEVIRDTLDTELKRLKNNMVNIGKAIGDKVLPFLKKFVGFLADIVQKVAEIFGIIEEPVTTTKTVDPNASGFGPITPGSASGRQSQSPQARLQRGKRKREMGIAEQLSPSRIMNEALEGFRQAFKLAELQGVEAVDKFDADARVKGILSSIFTKLSGEAGITADAAFSAVTKAFDLVKGSAEVNAVKAQQAVKQGLEAISDAMFETAKIARQSTADSFVLGFSQAAREEEFLANEYEAFARAEDAKLTAAKDAMDGVLDTAIGATGEIGSLFNSIMSASSGGPMAMLAAAFVNLMQSTKGFEAVMVPLKELFDTLVKLVEPFMEPLFYLATLFSNMATIFSKILLPIFNFVGEILGMFATGIANIANLFVGIVNLLIGIANFFGADLEEMDYFNLTEEYENTLADLNDETGDAADNFSSLNDELIESANVASGFKTNLRAFQAAMNDATSTVLSTTSRAGGRGPAIGMHAGGVVPGVGVGDSVPAMLTPGETVIPRGGSAGGVVIENMHVHVADTKDFMRKLTREKEWQTLVKTGSPIKGKLYGAR